MQECATVLIGRKKTRNNHKNIRKHFIKNFSLLFVVIACEQVGTQSAQGTLTREHSRREQVDTQETLVCKHVSTRGTLAREHVSTQGTSACEYVRHAI